MIQKLRGIKFFSKDTKIKMLSTPLNYTFDVFVNVFSFRKLSNKLKIRFGNQQAYRQIVRTRY